MPEKAAKKRTVAVVAAAAVLFLGNGAFKESAFGKDSRNWAVIERFDDASGAFAEIRFTVYNRSFPRRVCASDGLWYTVDSDCAVIGGYDGESAGKEKTAAPQIPSGFLFPDGRAVAVTEIGYRALAEYPFAQPFAPPCPFLESVGAFAFSGCVSLTSVDFSGCPRLKFIGNGAFSFCSALETVHLPAGVEKIEPPSRGRQSAFYGVPPSCGLFVCGGTEKDVERIRSAAKAAGFRGTVRACEAHRDSQTAAFFGKTPPLTERVRRPEGALRAVRRTGSPEDADGGADAAGTPDSFFPANRYNEP